jgi:hypothetical protein
VLNFLRQWNYTEAQLARLVTTVGSGRTVRTTHQTDIESIYPSGNGYTVVLIDENGVEREKEFESI